jgi:hypothetical protein
MTSIYDNGVYTLPSDTHLAKLFECKEPFLKSAPNARLYDIFDGNFNVKSKTPITPAKCYDVPVIKYANTAVFSDFPRGAGVNGTTFMYEDATYNEMIRAVERQNAEVPAFAQAENRLQEYDLAQRTGGNLLLVNDMVQNMKSELVREEENKIMRSLLRIPGMTGERAMEVLRRYKIDKDAKSLEATLSTPGIAGIIDEVMLDSGLYPELPRDKEMAMLILEIRKEQAKGKETDRLKQLKKRMETLVNTPKMYGYKPSGLSPSEYEHLEPVGKQDLLYQVKELKDIRKLPYEVQQAYAERNDRLAGRAIAPSIIEHINEEKAFGRLGSDVREAHRELVQVRNISQAHRRKNLPPGGAVQSETLVGNSQLQRTIFNPLNGRGGLFNEMVQEQRRFGRL